MQSLKIKNHVKFKLIKKKKCLIRVQNFGLIIYVIEMN